MKKLLVILPLVLCLVLSALPVFAEPGAEPVGAAKVAEQMCGWAPTFKLEKPEFLNCLDGKCYPVWAAVKQLCTKDGFDADFLLNKQPIWFKAPATLDTASLAQAFWNSDANPWAEDYNVAYPFINNVAKVTVKVTALESQAMQPNADAMLALANAKKLVEEKKAAVAAAQTAYDAAGGNTAENLEKLNKAKAELEAAEKALVEEQKKYDALSTTVTTAKVVEVPGILFLVENKFMPVTVTHHFIVGGKEVASYKEIVKVEAGTVLEKADGKEFASKFASVAEAKGFEKVELNEEMTKIVGGPEYDVFIMDYKAEAYKIDLYYTAAQKAEKDAEKVDAAKAEKADTNVAAATAAKALPATGVAETLPLFAAAVLVLFGFVAAKKH